MEDKVNAGLDPLEKAVGAIPGQVIAGIVLALIAVVALYVLMRILGVRRRKPPPQIADLTIDVTALPQTGPPPGGPAISFYGVPVRLAALVLAPAGRVRELPPPGELHDLLDSLLPGLSEVVVAHRPLIHRWPAQLSVRGFAHQFFSHAKLPGQAGKGTPWSAAAGMFKIEAQPIMVAMIFCAAAPTNLGQRILAEEAQWLDVFRIRGPV